MAKVVATERGYFGGEIREAGASFPVPDGTKLGKWMKPAGASVEVEAKAETVEDGGKPAKGKGKGKAKAETVEAPTAQPFADAPEPVRVVSEVNDALGATQPDWIAPGSVTPQPVND